MLRCARALGGGGGGGGVRGGGGTGGGGGPNHGGDGGGGGIGDGAVALLPVGSLTLTTHNAIALRQELKLAT